MFFFFLYIFLGAPQMINDSSKFIYYEYLIRLSAVIRMRDNW